MPAVLAFMVCVVLCGSFVTIMIKNRTQMQLLAMEQTIVEKSEKIHDVITKLLYKTQTLAAFVQQNRGRIDDFDRIAATLIDDPSIQNMLLAPDGVVSHVYPLLGNENVLHYNLLGEGEGNKEAVMARQIGELVVGGPFNLIQGGQAIVGRLPVWMDDYKNETKKFWGLVSVTLKYPQVLDGAGLDSLARLGFAYEVWRINPDDDQRQLIAYAPRDYNPAAPHLERPLRLLNAEWYFRLLPVRMWYEYFENWMLIFISLIISLLVAQIVQNNFDLKGIKSNLETMVRVDSLTGLLNRQGLFEELDPLLKSENGFVINYLDLNYFKQVNDNYGHSIGDKVLVTFVSRVRRCLNGSQIFARIGGDEFILAYESIPQEYETKFWQMIESQFIEPVISVQDTEIFLSLSRGSACYPQDGSDIDELLSCADKRMYARKNERYGKEQKRRIEDS